jgi:hypothetical protein
VTGAADFSGIADLGSTIERRGTALKAPPNTNLLYPKTFVPQLRGEIPSGETVLMTAAVALTDRFDVAEIWKDIPPAPAIDELEALIARDSRRVGALAWRMAP